MPGEPISAIHGMPRRSASSWLMMTSAHAPSEMGEELPAVTVPSARKAGRRPAREPAVVPGRTDSSLSTMTDPPRGSGTDTGMISSARRPDSWAPAALWCERAANSSCAWRLIGSRSLRCSVRRPMDCSVKASKRPSSSIWSAIVRAPYLCPRRASCRCGALLMDSCPPATTVVWMPVRICWSARMIAAMPDRHTLLTVSAGTVIGIPPFTAACRAGICPDPAVSTWPMTTASTTSPAIPARSRAAAIARPPSSGAVKPESDPSSFPTGVLAPATITLFITDLPFLSDSLCIKSLGWHPQCAIHPHHFAVDIVVCHEHERELGVLACLPEPLRKRDAGRE